MVKIAKHFSVFLSLVLVVTITLKMRSVSAAIYYETTTDDERYYLPSANWLSAMSLGYTEAAADLVWIKTVIYFGGRMLSGSDDAKGNYTINYLKTAVELNPYVRTFYTTGSALTLFQNEGVVSEPTVKMAMELLEEGTKVFPEDGELHFLLGFYHYYEMRPFVPTDRDDPIRQYHEDKGARLIGRASMMQGAPPYAALLSSSLLTKQGFDDLAISHLSSLLAKETDPTIRQSLKNQLRKELGKAAERDIDESERLLKMWRRDLPFIPYDLFLALQQSTSFEETLNPLYHSNKLLGLTEDGYADEDAAK